MSAVLPHQHASGPAGVAHVLHAWRSLRLRELVLFIAAGLLFGALDLSSLIEIDVGDKLPLVVTRHLFEPVVACLFLLLCWLPADRSDPDHPHRRRRLAFAALLGATLSILFLGLIEPHLPWPSVSDLMRAKKGLPPQRGLMPMAIAGYTLWLFLPSALMVAVIELLRRRRRSEQTVQRLLGEHSQLKRRAMASRLAALQAQVEPQLLFDALVDIEQAYARSDERAPARMEQLIRHLRVALPRLRESGSNLEAEAELLGSYLSVLEGLGRAHMRFETEWPDELRGASLPPMLLLPLLQRALRLTAAPPTVCSLRAETLPDQRLRIRLSFDRAGLCGDDAELDALNERLRVLTGSDTQLRCNSTDDMTRFIVDLSR